MASAKLQELELLGSITFYLIITLLVLSYVTVGLRLWVRYRLTRSPGWDDAAMVATLLLFSSYCAFVLAITIRTMNRKFLDKDNIHVTLIFIQLSEVFYILTTTFLKVSLGLFFLRVLTKRWQKIIFHVILAVSATYGLFYVFIVLFQCGNPVHLADNLLNPSATHCLPEALRLTTGYTYGIINVIADWTFVLIPISVLVDSELDRRSKISVSIVMGLGAVGSVSSILRMVYLDGLSLSTMNGLSPESVKATIWATAEPGTGIIAASIAILRPLFRKIASDVRTKASSFSQSRKASLPEDSIALRTQDSVAQAMDNKKTSMHSVRSEYENDPWSPTIVATADLQRMIVVKGRMSPAPRSPVRRQDGMLPSASYLPSWIVWSARQRRCFHEYFITHIPSTSLHPDSRPPPSLQHRLPRDKSTPYDAEKSSRSPAAVVGTSREMTVVRIPLKSAKHHFGVSLSRGTRPYNEDAYQAGTIDLPAFAKRRPMSLSRKGQSADSDVTPEVGASGDPQVFYFGVFDGHGGAECSGFLREQLHDYLEQATKQFELKSSLSRDRAEIDSGSPKAKGEASSGDQRKRDKESLEAIETHTPPGTEAMKPPQPGTKDKLPTAGSKSTQGAIAGVPSVRQSESVRKAEELEQQLVKQWKELVGGYFRRFKPEYFSMSAGGRGHPAEKEEIEKRHTSTGSIAENVKEGIGIETVLEYAFLKADYDFVAAQVGKKEEDPVRADKALNDDDILGQPSRTTATRIGGENRFKGGSTCSVALISTPTPSPFWHPSSPSSLITAHVGDTRILLCNTATGQAVPLTSNHHPSLPEEATRLRRFAASFVTDSFGEERMSGLANTRSFGDMASKRVGVSAEPEIRRIELSPAEYSFLILCSDGVSGHLSDQEIVDIVKEAKTPEQAARDVIPLFESSEAHPSAIMDINQVLEGTYAADASIRNSAEQQLQQAADSNFPQYLTVLGGELANEQAAPQIRQAAALALKNAFTAREYARLRQVQERWLNLDTQIKTEVKAMALRTLATQNKGVGSAAAQFIASVAAIEIPRNQWPELMTTLVENVGQGSDSQKQSSLTTIGFVCDTDDVELRDALAHHSNAILTAVVQGARKEEANNDVRVAAINALSDSIEFVRSNFDNEGERNYIMQVICEATQADDTRIQQGSYGCLNRIMGLYYDKMRFYMEKALFGLTIQGMKSDEEDVAKLAVEFWCTVCEEEIAIEDDNTQAQAEGSTELREYFNFARVATQEVVPVLLELLAKQDEDADDNEYNTSRAAYQCLQLWAQCVGSGVMPPVLAFIEKFIRSEDWHYRDASVSAFGAIMEGPEESVLDPIVKQALPTLIGMMDDQNIHVKDSAAYALGRICEAVPSALDAQQHLPPLIGALFNGLASNPKMAASCCWSLMNLADRFAGEPGCQTNPLSPHFAQSVQSLLQVTERGDADNTLRTAAYEVLNSFVNNAAGDSVPLVNELANVILERLEKSMALQAQVVNVEDKLTLEEMQTSLASVIMAIIQRMETDIAPQSDRIMQALLSLLSSLPPKSSVPDTVFAAIGSIATALEDDFQKYMEAFSPFLYNALNNQEEPALCSMAIGLVADITRSLGENVQPYCDAFMNSLLNNLRSPALGNQLKPAILQCFGDIAHAIHGAFETYLPVVAQVLQQAGQVTITTEGNYEMIDYITSLREGIMDSWDGCIVAMKSSNKTQLIVPYMDSIFDLLRTIQQDSNRTEALLRSSCGVIGDLADAFPAGDFREYFRHDFLTAMARETRANTDFSSRTRDTARWAREQIKRQIGTSLQNNPYLRPARLY
ncbi:importin subunit beta-1 [Stemphylium lycopersici]|nr:importin subunit beta-1 [Stemphylium lycopersici]